MKIDRKIKFRVWDRADKKWIHGPGEEVNLFGECILMGEFMPVSLGKLNDCVALQFTGLTDSKNQEIYEGDIIRFESEPGEKITRKIVFESGRFGIWRGEKTSSFLLSPWTDTCEIVGNIFENSELLETK